MLGRVHGGPHSSPHQYRLIGQDSLRSMLPETMQAHADDDARLDSGANPSIMVVPRLHLRLKTPTPDAHSGSMHRTRHGSLTRRCCAS
ncbi:hypothetical protein Naga_101647g2 [Nannochloropsis gaditana]|uniref:Uncharacterized protein n=1 Tax=Nannochloropsis gaditana TaxID=72520 RepID=W7TRT7_9STRA|nr:hypothetical protein Naga_101647g2 [Nannochloropsis gaditana]